MSEAKSAKVIYKPLYVVMHEGCDGPIPSLDTGNPFCTLSGAQLAIARMGKIKSPVYYIVKFLPAYKIRAGRKP